VPPARISAVLIARDEEKRIAAALESVSWADEIVVVDGGSRDGTRELARAAGARVVEREWTGFVDQKNFALEQAAHDWVLSLDADERVPPKLADEIRALAKGGFRACGYRVPRVAFYLGRFVRSTDWYPDWQLRLFDRRRGRWCGMYVHESVRVDGPIEKLGGELHHYPYENLAAHWETINRYSGLAAAEMRESGRRGRLAPAFLHPPVVFFKNYVLKAGFKDGSAGLVVSSLNAAYVFLKYLKLWELERSFPIEGS